MGLTMKNRTLAITRILEADSKKNVSAEVRSNIPGVDPDIDGNGFGIYAMVMAFVLGLF